jgi:hypothetical protein
MEIKKMPKKQISKNNYNEPDNSSQLNIIHENNITRTNDNGINSAFLEINGNKKNAKYICKPCNFICNKNANYQSHLLTNKHYKNTNECCNVITNKCNNCDKEFSTLSGLWKHRKKCSIEVEVPKEAQTHIQGTKLTVGSSDIPIELILEVIKQSKEVQNVLIEQNKELQKQLLEHSNKLLENENRLLEKDNQLIEQNKQILEIARKPNMINSNNNNKTSFNLQFFLNETCKDAMNIVDFVNSLQLTNNDFETTGKLGFVNGISRIFINNLKKMDVIRRPLHCTDVKRETLYIKDNDTWEKETDEKKKLNWVVNRIAQLNLNQIQQWQKQYPDCVKNNTPANEKFTELALVALGGRGEDEILKFNDKIMKNVLKEVILSREPTVPSDAPSL